ncbi:MAG: hypothetical protein JXA30_15670 [Deltaproteobacteria bacterium]|nr:hypothetical protein [Deltaproteobacteria bacterium]
MTDDKLDKNGVSLEAPNEPDDGAPVESNAPEEPASRALDVSDEPAETQKPAVPDASAAIASGEQDGREQLLNSIQGAEQPLVLEDEEGLFSNADDLEDEEDGDLVKAKPADGEPPQTAMDTPSVSVQDANRPATAVAERKLTREPIPPRESETSESEDSVYPTDSESEELDFEREFYAQFESRNQAKRDSEAEEIDDDLLNPIDEHEPSEIARQRIDEEPEAASERKDDTTSTSGIISRLLSSPPSTPPTAPEPSNAEREIEPQAALTESDGSELPELGVDDIEPERSEDRELADEADSEIEAGEAAASAAAELDKQPQPSTPDEGAIAARRTIHRRAVAHDVHPLANSDADGLRERSAFLVNLAQHASGGQKAQLLVAAAELRQRVGEPDQALALYQSALEIDRANLVALRAVRREACVSGNWSAAAELLKTESELALSPQERGLVLTLLAEVRLRQLADIAGALEAAKAALTVYPGTITAGLLLAEIHFSEHRQAEGIEALQQVASSWQDSDIRQAILAESAHALERIGEAEKAARLYRQALEINPRSLAALVNVVSSSRAIGDFDTSINTLLAISELFDPGPVRDALVRIAARYAHHLKRDPKQALSLLLQDGSLLAIRTRERAAAESGDRAAQRAAIEAWTQISSASERAIAFVEIARGRMDAGEFEDAKAALREAALADNRVGMIRVIRETIARKKGETSDLTAEIEGEDKSNALTLAAKLARLATETTGERRMLELSTRHCDGVRTAEIIALDAAAEDDDRDWVRSALLQEAENAVAENRVGPLFALLYLYSMERDKADSRGQPRADQSTPKRAEALATEGHEAGDSLLDPDQEAVEIVEESQSEEREQTGIDFETERSERDGDALDALPGAEIGAEDRGVLEPAPRPFSARGEQLVDLFEKLRAALPGSPIALRQMARASGDREKAAGYFLEECAASQGMRAAFAATAAGRYLQSAGLDPLPAFRQALESTAGYGPACWAMEISARAVNDTEALVLVHEQLAEHALCPQEKASRFARAALYRSAQDRSLAIELLRRALEIHPQDSVVNELILRLLGVDSTNEIAERLLVSARDDSPEAIRAARLRAAAAYENGRELEKAAELYQTVIETSQKPEPIALFALERLELALGRHDQVREQLAHALRQASDDRSRAACLYRLIEFEREHGDESDALAHLKALVQIQPDQIACWRMLERHYLERSGSDEALRITAALVDHLTDPTDVSAYLRQLVRLKQLPHDAPAAGADEIILKHADRAVPDLWLTQKLEAAARAANDSARIAQALSDAVMHYSDPMERASIALCAAEQASGEVLDDVMEKLGQAVAEAADHPVAAEELGSLLEKTGKSAEAARAYEMAAAHAHNSEREARLWRQAAVIWQDELGDNERARAALVRAKDADLMCGDVFSRLRSLLRESGETAELAELLRVRIEKGGDGATLAQLNLELSGLQRELGNRSAAKAFLGAALGSDPQHVIALSELAKMHLDDQQWREAADILIRLARLTKDNQQLCWLFFRLGDIYQKHLPDLQRAEIAFTRIVKLQPENVEAIERLIEIFQQQQMHAKAARALQRLVQLSGDRDSRNKNQLRFAAELEHLDQQREAEEILESCRKESPTDIVVINALTEFYRRQQAHNALSMHLNRSSSEFRSALKEDPTKVENWRGLVEVLLTREQIQSAQSCASTAVAFGVSDAKLHAMLIDGAATPLVKALGSAEIDRIIAPSWLTDTVRFVFGGTAFALDRAAPFNAKGLGVERLKKKSEQLERIVKGVCQGFGLSSVLLYTSSRRICIPVSNDPLAVLVGESLLEETTEAEKRFLLTRAIKLAVNNLAVLVRTPPDEIVFVVNALIRHFDSEFEPEGMDTARLEETARQIGRFIPRKYHAELSQNVFEIKGMAEFDPRALSRVTTEFGSRAALVATGSSPAALTALLKIDEVAFNQQSPEQMLAAIRRSRDAESLFSFALSDAFLSARQRAFELQQE